MKTVTTNPTTVISRWTRVLGTMLTLALMVSAVAVSQTAPALGTSVSFGILAAGAISGTTTVTGNVGTSTADAIAGSITVAGGYTKYNPGDGVVLTAHNDFLTAYGLVTSQNPDGNALPATFPAGGLGSSGTPCTAGVFDITSPASMTTDLYLSGSASDIFIFKTASSLNTTAGTTVHLAGGAVWSNIYWQVGAAVTLAGTCNFEGTILCNAAISVGATTVVHGRLLGNGAVSVTTATSVGASEIPLPVELVSFTASATGLNANLHWSTATEVHNYGFEIQRRQTADWAKVGFVAGAGTSSSVKNYSYTDNNLSAGNYSYRLKQVDIDGSFSYGASVEVAISSAPQAFALLQNYPNPFNPSTVISYQLPVNSQVTLKVYNLLGQEVASLVNGLQQAGSHSVTFNTAAGTRALTTGVYVYRLQAGSFISMKKLVLMK